MSTETTAGSHNSNLDPADDYVHQPARGIDRWAENIQWNVRDDAGLGVILHAGTMIRNPLLWHVVVTVTTPEGGVYTTKAVAPGAGNFGPPGAQLRTVEPFKRWRLEFYGGMLDVTGHRGGSGLVPDDQNTAVQIDLDLSALYPVWIPEGSAQFGDWGRFHHEQAVTVNGSISINGTVRELSGVGHRDHSIGPRDMSKLRTAFWGNGVFESGWAFAAMHGQYIHADFQRAALFDADGSHEATMIDWPGLTSAIGDPAEFSVELRTANRTLNLQGRLRGGMSFTVVDGAEFCLGTDLERPERYFLTNYFVDWFCDGERGVGYLDRGSLIQLLNEEEQ
ncbi:hypothetical protein [Nocardia carnea]|uniref:hypothetical protein n=1 Tax=Nocardia carnea TaxID=37328 RepID=UPI002458ED02|nr:hypothetical protein [Nocardia carnea]